MYSYNMIYVYTYSIWPYKIYIRIDSRPIKVHSLHWVLHPKFNIDSFFSYRCLHSRYIDVKCDLKFIYLMLELIISDFIFAPVSC